MNARAFSSPASRKGAFTLIEMLVVLAIIAIIMAVAAPGVFSALNASRLTSSGDRLLGLLSEAQQTAFAKNQAVEMRFYQYSEAMNITPGFRAVQTFTISNPPGLNEERLTKLSELVKFADGVVVTAEPSLSPLLSSGLIADNGESNIPGASYVALRFFPDGTCKKVNVSGTLATLTIPTLPTSFVTVIEESVKNAGSGVPENFYTVQVDPYTGRSRSYRPGF